MMIDALPGDERATMVTSWCDTYLRVLREM
jgi:hypothetical protein